jgi:hypothetical protein
MHWIQVNQSWALYSAVIMPYVCYLLKISFVVNPKVLLLNF